MQKIATIKDRVVLIDTNILILYARKGFVERSGNPLRVLLDNSNQLRVSEITRFELLRGENENGVKEKFLEFINFIPNITV